jgi:hypothetical protein
MTVAGWVMMVLVLGGVWGGFVYLLAKAARRGPG